MTFPARFLDELRGRIGLADVVGKRVRLVRKGREHSGLCPFHKEKSPSFTVNEEKGFYHCFGCGAHGSVFDFVMQTEGLSFPEAVERLAGEAGMEVPNESPEERAREKERQTLYDVCEAATAFFEKSLRMPEGKAALDYLRGRGLDEATIERFRLGFAPDSRGALKAALAREKFSDALMIEAGLLIQPDDAGRMPYDRFRGRVMFPITDRRDRPIAFGGRIMAEGEPKYLNSPETPLFHKGYVLYGLALAGPQIHKTGSVVVSEGYMDVIALHRAGFDTAVAPLGTALTEDHLRGLWKLAREPVICLDGDAAGLRAAGRAVERALPLLKPGYSLKIATLPPGEDPDSLIKTAGPAAMGRVLEGAVPLSEFLWRMEVGNRAPSTPEERAWIEEKLKRQAARIEDETVRRYFLDAFRDRLWQAFRNRARPAPQGRGAYGGSQRHRPATFPVATQRTPMADHVRRREQILLAVLLNHPSLYDEIGERLGLTEFSAPDLDKLRQEVLKTLTGAQGLDREALHLHLRDKGFAEGLNAVLGPRVAEHAFFAQPDCPPHVALQGWEETFILCRQADLQVELREAERCLADDPSPESLDRLRELKSQEQALFEDGPDGDPDGFPSGLVGERS